MLVVCFVKVFFLFGQYYLYYPVCKSVTDEFLFFKKAYIHLSLRKHENKTKPVIITTSSIQLNARGSRRGTGKENFYLNR